MTFDLDKVSLTHIDEEEGREGRVGVGGEKEKPEVVPPTKWRTRNGQKYRHVNRMEPALEGHEADDVTVVAEVTPSSGMTSSVGVASGASGAAHAFSRRDRVSPARGMSGGDVGGEASIT